MSEVISGFYFFLKRKELTVDCIFRGTHLGYSVVIQHPAVVCCCGNNSGKI